MAATAGEEELRVPEDMFKDVKFFAVGDIDPQVPPPHPVQGPRGLFHPSPPPR